MSTAKKTAAKKATKKSVWDEQTSVQPTAPVEKVSDNPDEGSPFGSMTSIMKLITGFREQVKETPIEMNGRATAPDGTVYAYYLSEDVLGAAQQYCNDNKAFLDTSMIVDGGGSNLMRLELIDVESGHKKRVEANLGNPTSTADFGTRITYAPKYLVAMMFGISVQTDSDAFNNGKNIQHGTRTQNGGSDDVAASDNTNTGNGNTATTSNNSVPDAGSGASDGTQGQVEHSQSYLIAKQFIEQSLNNAVLDQAEQKVNKATGLHDFEKEELRALISEKRKTVS